uniref:BESS domain-containing protein n=1 Tax=Meloidogyne javanica TaxID=6303 RepID=A0A915LBW4_MELJA
MPPKPIPAPQKVIKGGKGIKLSDNAFSEESENSDFSDSEVTVEYESENSEHLNVTTNDNKSLSAEKEIVQKEKSTILKSKREKLVKECKTQSTNSDGRGSHSREAGYLLRIRALTSDCLSLIPRDGCRTVEKRAEFWTKLELINEAIQQTIRHANEWDNTHQNDLQSSSG